MLDTKSPVTQALDGRAIERYIHGPRPEWGYPVAAQTEWSYPQPNETGAQQQNHNSFYVAMPKHPRENAPLYVVLHSANRTAYDYLAYGLLDRKIDKADDPSTVMSNTPPDFYGLYLNSTNAEWWGWSEARRNAAKGLSSTPAAERRVLDTIEWIVQRYKIDRNRIYLSGVSMGGNGTLGIGMHHGDIFAAIRATVPAGTNFASYSMGGFAPSPGFDASQSERETWRLRAAAPGIPDPPVTVDFSSWQDGWSVTQPALINAAQEGHLPLILSWGPFGHATFASAIAKSPLCQVALEFPWLEIRKNEAYAVFTHASSDQQSAWQNAPAEFKESGQMNAYFRWKADEDTPARFSIKLWIDHPHVTDPPPAMPNEAIADVTLRRLQQFKVATGKSYEWHLTQGGRLVASGKIKPDLANLLTFPHLPLTTTQSELSVASR